MSKAFVLAPGEGEKFWILGDHATFKAGPDQTGGKYSVGVTWVPPGGGPPPHMHRREEELFFVLEGQVLFMSDKQTFVGGPGTVVWLKRNIPHTFKNVGDTPIQFVLVAAPSGFEAFARECGEPIDKIPCDLQVTPAAIEKLFGGAPKFGIEVLPDHKPTGEAPPRPKDRKLWVFGQLITLKLTGEQSGGQFTVVEVASQPGSPGVLSHRHVVMDEFFYVLEGEFEFVLDGKPTRAPAGAYVHVPHGVLHGFRNAGKGIARLADFHTPGGFDRFFEECGVECTDPNKPPALVPPDMEKMRQLLARHGMEIPA